MRPLRHLLRLIRMSNILARYRLDEITDATHLFRPVKLIRMLAPWGRRKVRDMPRGERLRLALQELGPIYVKFGQVLSTRRDLLPIDIADQLAKLQDEVEPFPGTLARTMVSDALGMPLEEAYSRFDTEPLASASIAQVHTATMHDGSAVVVKVLRPNVSQLIRRDVDLLLAVASLAERFWAEARRVKPLEFVREFERTVFDELDLQREAANASLLHAHWESSRSLYIPVIHWSHTREQVLTMERVDGIPINDLKALNVAGINLQRLAERGVEIFYTQVFRDNLFHADMHPGNILVSRETPDDPTYISLDFGIVGSLSDSDLRYVAENFAALFERDYRRVAELHVEAGWVPADTRIEELEAAARAVSEPHFSKPLCEISFGELLFSLFRMAKRFDLEIQPQLVLLQKTLLNIEGIGRELYPQLDPWSTARPVLRRIMREKYGVRRALTEARKRLPHLLEKAPEMPDLVQAYLQTMTEGRMRVRQDAAQRRSEMEAQERNTRRAVAAIVAGALIIGSAILITTGEGLQSIEVKVSLVLTSLALWHAR